MSGRPQQPSLEIFDRAQRYLIGDLRLVDIEDWLVPNLGYFLAEANTTGSELAATIELGLAELGENVIDESEFRGLLNEFFLTHPNTFAIIGGPSLRTGADNEVAATVTIALGASQRAPRYERIEL